MSTDILTEGGDEKYLLLPSDRIPPSAWQAIYYHLSKKVETRRKLYPGAFEIAKDDLIDIVNRLNQAITGYGPRATKVEFEIDFRHDTSEKLTSLEKFIALDFAHKRSCAKRISVDLDFILSPATELTSDDKNPPQKFKVFC